MSFTPFFIMRGAIPAGIPAKNPLHGGCRIDRFGCPETQIAPYKLQGRQDFRNGNAFAVIKRFGNVRKRECYAGHWKQEAHCRKRFC